MTLEHPEEVVYAQAAERRRMDEAFDEMLSALEAAHAYLENAGPVVMVEQMRAAIAKAKAV